jgi:GAF domain-containing protein
MSADLLISSLDYDLTLRRVARMLIPRQADWCLIYVPQGENALTTRLAIAHAKPTQEAALRSVWHRQPYELPQPHPLHEVMRTGQSVAVADCSAEVVASLAGSTEGEDVLRRIGVRSIMALPLVAQGTCIGGLMIVASKASRRPYDEAAIESIRPLANSAAHAIYNARLFSEAKLALRLRDEVIVAASRELLGLMENVRRRTEGLRWSSARRDAMSGPSVNSSLAAIDTLADQMEQLIGELRLIVDATRVKTPGRAP